MLSTSSFCLLVGLSMVLLQCVAAAPHKVFLCNTYPGPKSQAVLALGPTLTQLTASPMIPYQTCSWWTIDDTWIVGNASIFFNNNFTAPAISTVANGGFTFCADSNFNVLYINEQTGMAFVNNPINNCTIVAGYYRVSFFNALVATGTFLDFAIGVGSNAPTTSPKFANMPQDSFNSADFLVGAQVSTVAAYLHNTATLVNGTGLLTIATGIQADTNVVVVLSGDATNPAQLWVQYTVAPSSGKNAAGAQVHLSAASVFLAMSAAIVAAFFSH